VSDASELTGVAAWAVGVMETLGGPGAGLLIALENLFPPIPSEVVLPLAGFTASQGGFTLTGAIFWTTLGSVVGALLIYGVGAALGRDRFRALCGRLPLVRLEDLDRAEEWFDRHGSKAVFLGRMLPLIRSLISIPAGMERMALHVFLPLTVAGSLIWNTLFIVAGYQLGQNWHVVDRYADVFQALVVVVVLSLAGWFVVRRVRDNRARGSRDGAAR
jgi:membrane protein DedA with SNARE-associated domain